MPTRIRKRKGGGYTVSSGGKTKAKRTSRKKAVAQKRLLDALDHGYRPPRRKRRGR